MKILFLRTLFFCMPFFFLSLPVRADESYGSGGSAGEGSVYPVSAGQTEVSAWVEVPDDPKEDDSDKDDPDKNDPDKNEPDGDRESEDTLKGNETGHFREAGKSVKTADQNLLIVSVMLLLLSGIVITVERIKNTK